MTAVSHTLSPPSRSISLKSSSYHRKSLFVNNSKLKKKVRPSTWSTTCHNSKYRRYTISPRVSRWVSQHNQSKRQTVATISTMTTSTNSDTTTINAQPNVNDTFNPDSSIFHTQSLLFLFGFLYFPCWWIGGYYLKVEDIKSSDIEKPVIVHSSLLANGKTASRILWLSSPAMIQHEYNDTRMFFYKCNRCMSLVSIGLILVELSMIIWYFVAYH